MNTREQSRIGRKMIRHRNEVLRSLDIVAFDRYCRKWKVPIPAGGWLPLAREILMHKSRVEFDTFSDDEKEFSRRWLIEHGFSDQLGTLHMTFAPGEWWKIPLALRKRYWLETDYGKNPPTIELAELIWIALGKMTLCEDCGKNPADPPSKLCPGCRAYKEHTT